MSVYTLICHHNILGGNYILKILSPMGTKIFHKMSYFYNNDVFESLHEYFSGRYILADSQLIWKKESTSTKQNISP